MNTLCRNVLVIIIARSCFLQLEIERTLKKKGEKREEI